MHDQIFRLAVELLSGIDLQFTDEHGRRWRASATCLAWEDVPVIEGDAFDVAIEVGRRDPARGRPRSGPTSGHPGGGRHTEGEELLELLAGIGSVTEKAERMPSSSVKAHDGQRTPDRHAQPPGCSTAGRR